jgi:hypothetical protein
MIGPNNNPGTHKIQDGTVIADQPQLKPEVPSGSYNSDDAAGRIKTVSAVFKRKASSNKEMPGFPVAVVAKKANGNGEQCRGAHADAEAA